MKKHKYSQYISLGYDSNGKRIRKRVYANSKNELALKKAQMQEQYRNCTISCNITFGEYSARWLEVFKRNVEVATRNMYAYVLRYVERYNCTPLKDIRVIDLQEIINENSEHPRFCQQISLTLKQIWNSAINDGLVTRNIAKQLKLPNYIKKERRSLTEEEKDAIKKCDFDQVEMIYINTLFYLGVRPAEALSLQANDFDFINHNVTISRACGYNGNNPYIKVPKTKKTRIIPLPQEYERIAREYIENNQSMFLVSCKNGKMLTKTMKTDLWLRIRKKINIQLGGNDNLDATNGLIPYYFRHNYCCNCYYSGISPLMTSRLMGNSVEMVMKVYAHLDESKENLDALRKFCM